MGKTRQCIEILRSYGIVALPGKIREGYIIAAIYSQESNVKLIGTFIHKFVQCRFLNFI